MKITDVNLKVLTKDATTKAIASMTLDNCFVIHNIKVLDVNGNIFVAMPSKKISDGNFKDLAHPINKETRSLVETAVLDKYYQTVQQLQSEGQTDSHVLS